MEAGDIVAKSREFVKHHQGRLWTGLCLVLAVWPAYNLGLIHARRGAQPLQEKPLFQARNGIVSQATEPSPARQGSGKPAPDRSDLRVVVSKSSSSKKYHHAWCAGAKQIKEANRLWLPSAEAAQAAGYTLAGNCKF